LADGIAKKVGTKLARTRESMGLTLQKPADLSGVAPSTIQKIETGAMMPSIAVIGRDNPG
jgi:transcriptional regulator with XRE-family HTH domain